jgi:phospho-N-acetylmuramoyl-pentapeptide-transferase
MLYHLLSPYTGELNLFSFVTFRVALGLTTGLILTMLFGYPMILWLRKKQGKGQPIRTDGPESHQAKKGTPTMGGFLILFGILSGTLLWADLTNQYIWIVLFVTVGFCFVGFIDDYQKVTKKGTAGLSGKVRLLMEFVIAGIAVWWISVYAQATTDAALAAGTLAVAPQDGFATGLALPFLKDFMFDLTIYGFIAFGAFVIVGAGNAVNFTDGLDGLAIGPVMIAGATFGFIAYATGTPRFADYLLLSPTPGTA